MSLKNSRYRELDALRGIAAIVVVLFHYTMDREQAKLGFELGVTGVDLFFIISGFVIFMSINKVSSTLEFIINRFTRLFPLYWSVVTFTFLLQVIIALVHSDMASISIVRYLGNLTMFQYYFKLEDIDGPYWTMLVEMLFYISIAILYSLKKIKYVLPIGLTVLLLCVINDLFLDDVIPHIKGIYRVFPLLLHFPLFLAGIIFYKLVNTANDNKQKIYLYGCLAFCFITKLLLADDGGVSLLFISFNQYVLALSIYFALFILFANNWLSFLVSRPALFLGRISFSLYLLHNYLGRKVIIHYLVDSAHLNYWLAALVALVIVVLLATAISNYIEFPFDRKLNNKLRTRFGIPTRGKAR